MKRWVWLGLVGLLACKGEDPDPDPPPVEETDCTDTTEQGGAPGRHLMSALKPEGPAQDGREGFLIRYRRTLSSASAAQSAGDAVTRAGGVVTAKWSHLGSVAARLTPEEKAALARDPDVLAISPDRPVYAFALSRQPLVTAGSVGEYTPGLKLVQAPAVWDSNPEDGVLDDNAPNGTGIRVCVIDSGWDDRHPELRAAYVGGKDFVEDDDDPRDYDTAAGMWGGGHGTHTAATIVAQLASSGTMNPDDKQPAGVVGVAPGVELLVARVLNTRGSGNTSDIITALKWCQDQEAHIASLSLGAEKPDEDEKAAFDAAIAAGLLPIAATGNGGTGDPRTEPGVSYPAAYPGVLAVGAVNEASERAVFSQIGPQVGLMGPGTDVLSAVVMGSESFSVVDVNGTVYESRSLAFAPLGEYSGQVLACGLGDSVRACGDEATCSGFVAYVDRGGLDSTGAGLTFAKKVDFMRRAGARAVIIGNNDPTDGAGSFTLGDPGTWLPTASVSTAHGTVIKALKGGNAKVKLVGVDYARLSGTSMATPHVTGVAALVWSARPSLSAAQVKQLLLDSAKDLGPEKRDSIYGYGLVQAKAALDLLNTRFPATP